MQTVLLPVPLILAVRASPVTNGPLVTAGRARRLLRRWAVDERRQRHRVSTEGSDASYVIKVGGPITALSDDLQDTSEAAQAFSDNVFSRTTVVTDSNGQASVAIEDSNVETAVVQAYKYPDPDTAPSARTVSGLRNFSDSRDAPAVYFPSRPKRVDLPASTTVTMTELSYYELLLPDHPRLYAHTRTLDEETLFVVLNWIDVPVSGEVSVDATGAKPVLGNYERTPEPAGDEFRPYEATVFQL